MVKVKEVLTGKQFGRLTVLEQTDDYVNPRGKHVARWLCECCCKEHNKIKVTGARLKDGTTQSCGCLARELASARRKETNKVDLSGSFGIGWTTNTNKEFYFDLEDYDKIKNYCWIERFNKKTGGRWLAAKIDNKSVKMFHLLGFKGHDHKNRNPLDNRKENLRPATVAENSRNSSISRNNTSGFIGVSWTKKSANWHAYITYNNQRINLGYFSQKYDAIIARLKAELSYFGPDFSPQRHLFKQYGIIQSDNNSTKLMEV